MALYHIEWSHNAAKKRKKNMKVNTTKRLTFNAPTAKNTTRTKKIWNNTHITTAISDP